MGLGAWASGGKAMAGSQLSIKDKISPPAAEGKEGCAPPPPQTGESHLQPGSPQRSLARR